MAEAAAVPPREAVAGWVGFEVDEVGGAAGRQRGRRLRRRRRAASRPGWSCARAGRRPRRRRRAAAVAVPPRDCAGAGGRVWVAHEREALRSAPAVDPTRPLLREHELTICAHYGIGERVGRAAEVAGRPEGTVTAQPRPERRPGGRAGS